MGVGAQLAMWGQAQALEPSSPSILAGDLLYVSGQGAQDAQGRVPREPAAQIRQCLSKVRTIVQAAGLTMEHVVYVQVYLTDYTDEGPLNQGWKEFFPQSPPARSTIGVASLGGGPVEMTAVAVKDLARKKTLAPPGYPSSSPLSPGVLVGDRLFLSGHLGRNINTGQIPQEPEAQVQLSIDRMRGTLKLAGADLRNVVFMIPYVTDRVSLEVLNRVAARNFDAAYAPAWTPIRVIGLPSGANVEFTGVAILDLNKRQAVRLKKAESSPASSACVLAEDTFYCSAAIGVKYSNNVKVNRSSVETQTRETMRNLRDCLAQVKMNFSNVVATHVYLDDIRDADLVDRVYAPHFAGKAPARTVIQLATPASGVADAGVESRGPEQHKSALPLEEISIIAVK
jgi:enamine deaminase RidA (YjgF/YER057c/UK114 family)